MTNDIPESLIESQIDIGWDDAVGDKTLKNGGYVGDLMEVALAHIDEALNENRISSSEAGQIYAAMIQSAFSEGIKFAKEKQLIEYQTEAAAKQLETEDLNQLSIIAKVKDSLGFDISSGMLVDADEERLTHTKQTALLDAQHNKTERGVL